MRKIYFTILLFCLTGFVIKNQSPKNVLLSDKQNGSNDSLILWKQDLKLTWNDFQGEINKSSEYKAMTFATVKAVPIFYSKDSIVYTITSNFEKKLSWSKDKSSSSLLKHEQLHFDIAELVARKMRFDCSKLKIKELKKTYSELSYIFDYYTGKYIDSLDNKYDIETNHGTIEKKQKDWELKIAKELKSLDKYSNTRVVVRRAKEKK